MSSGSGVPLADISTNFFAAFLMMLIAGFTVGGIGTTGAGDAVERRALRGEEMVDLLYDRRGADGGRIVDVFEDHVEIPRAGGVSRAAPDAGAIAAALHGERTASLFVFGHGAYGAAIAALKDASIPWREMSVPHALRDSAGAGWSAAFRALSAQAASREAFREGLARLLAGGGRVGGDMDAALQPAPAPGARIAAFLFPLSAGAALAGCVLLARWAERQGARWQS